MTVEGVRVGVDVGGTFTDLVACDAAGRTSALKVPTTPTNPAGGLLNGLTAIGRMAGRCASLAHGTTLVTNAIVERKIGVVGLVTTRGFRDVLEIGRMNRPHLYRIDLPAKPEPLVRRRLRAEVSERVGPDGSVLASLDLGEVPAIIERFRRQGVESVAICLLHRTRTRHTSRRCGERLPRISPTCRPRARSTPSSASTSARARRCSTRR